MYVENRYYFAVNRKFIFFLLRPKKKSASHNYDNLNMIRCKLCIGV